jgi:hypothetical protein
MKNELTVRQKRGEQAARFSISFVKAALAV